jgi:hypothetical protein
MKEGILYYGDRPVNELSRDELIEALHQMMKLREQEKQLYQMSTSLTRDMKGARV